MDSIYSWIFFSAGAKSTSMRWALEERPAENGQVIILGHPVSALRIPKDNDLNSLVTYFGGKKWEVVQPTLTRS